MKPTMTVNEVSKLTGVSIRALQYYDTIGLLSPCKYTRAGYRLYDAESLERLQQILLFRELEFPLKEIKEIVEAPDFDRDIALQQQIELLTLKKEHLEGLIKLARKIKKSGVNRMEFEAFDTSKIDEYSKRAKELWGNTDEYKEYAKKSKNQTKAERDQLTKDFMQVFAEFGQMREDELSPASKEVQAQVKKLHDFINENYYKCSYKMLRSLGQMYSSSSEFRENIDNAGGTGTADFTDTAIAVYCLKA